MQLTKFSVLVVFSIVFSATKFRANIVSATSSSDERTSILFENLANIIESCYGDRIDAVGIAGDVPATFLRTLSVRQLIPVVLIDDTEDTSEPIRVPVELRRKLQVFVIRIESLEHLGIIVKNMKNTIWWNHMASFFIIDRSSRCRTSTVFLFQAWIYNLINAKVICYYEPSTGIVSYNPYKNQAPYDWEHIQSVAGVNGHPFNVFLREYQRNKGTCVDLDFDKTKDTAGYAIRVEGQYNDHELNWKDHKSSLRFMTANEIILQSVFRALNGTPHYMGHRKFDGRIRGDVRRYLGSLLFTWNTVLTAYPHTNEGYVVISNFRGHKSQLEKILCVIDLHSRIGLGVVYLITLMFLKFFVGQALLPVLLNLTRITCNTGFRNLLNDNATRIYLTALLFFVVTIQGIYQGNLASLLTTVIPLRNPNTVQDLVNLDYKKIYIRAADKRIIDHPALRERWVELDPASVNYCATEAHRDTSTACIAYGHGSNIDQARSLKMHVSGNAFSRNYACFAIRWDWPLEQRFNVILSRLVEGDLLDTWESKCDPMELSEFEFDDEVKNNKAFKIIELNELTFSFVILGIGIVCSIVTFIVELAVHRFQSRNSNVRSMYPRGVCTVLS